MVYFMRVPKTGSQALVDLIRSHLRFKHNFTTFYRVPSQMEKSYLTAHEQKEIVDQSLSRGENTVFFSMHENYIEFSSFNLNKPIYISLIRNPIEKEISWYYYVRSRIYDAKNYPGFVKMWKKRGGEQIWRNKSFEDCVKEKYPDCQYIPGNPNRGQFFKRQSIQFCGNNENCWTFGSPTAIQMAKDNVERNFAVVGSWEDAEVTLTVLERYIPKYFKGALKIYMDNYQHLSQVNKNKDKPKVSEEIKQILYKNFTGELDFYYFCKQRLYKQYLAIKQHNGKRKFLRSLLT